MTVGNKLSDTKSPHTDKSVGGMHWICALSDISFYLKHIQVEGCQLVRTIMKDSNTHFAAPVASSIAELTVLCFDARSLHKYLCHIVEYRKKYAKQYFDIQ